ncbi:heme exporter protein CcmA [Rhodothermus marinus SG0.5JP17-172]|uniref:heme ABC exporter ATP-binding protein CcmA n=1 Tax=Rhodothermus marinus TaxID=29549 RepID=UPI000223D857|nr:heme ABC exporter ATP-binding protein CcmA [Rhodothermus marinus]AEN73393.1 heme exporter protein CcmA [Rhodothermus marinus SG0.5JP17-172]
MDRLEVIALGKRFGYRRLFAGLSFTLAAGETLAVTGPNGSGKSTLLRMLAGVLRPSEGAVRLQVDGRQVEPADRPFYVGLAAPYLQLYDGFTARENLTFIARARGLYDERRLVESWLERVQLRAFADEPVAIFSSGMRQRLRLAAALLADPPLWLLDEPRSNLDEAGRRLVEALLEEACAKGRLVVVATNDADEAAACMQQVDLRRFR